MQYLGSKNRIAKHLIPTLLKHRGDRTWVEPFVGGANMIDKIDGDRIGADNNFYLIEFMNAVKAGWLPPEHISKDKYYWLKNNPDLDPKLTFWAAVGCSFGAKWFGGWVNDYSEKYRKSDGSIPNYQKGARKSLALQAKKLKGVRFELSDYASLEIPENSFIYCDPPYKGTTGYRSDFDHAAFWDWCRLKSKDGHVVIISEYNAPSDFENLLALRHFSNFNNISAAPKKESKEKLFKFVDGNGLL